MAYLRDRQTCQTSLVSVTNTGNNPGKVASAAALSRDGRYVVFMTTSANVVPDDNNNVQDVFLLDRETGDVSRVSVATGGVEANGESYGESISDDGRYIVFESLASNLVIGDTNDTWDVFVHDRQTNETTRISVASNGEQANNLSGSSVISADGRYVAFTSSASNLVTGDNNNTCGDGQGNILNCEDIYLHDRITHQTTLVSVSSKGIQGNSFSDNPTFSANGRYLAFYSAASNLVDNDTNMNCLDNENRPISCVDVFVRDLLTGEITLESLSSDDTQGNLSSAKPSISDDGRYIAFVSESDNLVPNDNNNSWDIFVRDRLTSQTILVSVSATGEQGNKSSNYPSISADGRFVTFHTKSTNLFPGANDGISQIYVSRVNFPTPSAPNAVPQRNYVTTQPITLTWNPVTWAVRYQVQVDVSTAFTAPIMDASMPELQLSTLDPGTYFWHVRAIRANSTPGAWSRIESFTVGLP